MATTSGQSAISNVETADEGSRGRWQSAGLSILIHTGLLVALALIWTSRPLGRGDEGPRRVAIVLSSPNSDSEYFDEADLQEADASTATNANPSPAIPDEAPPVDVSTLVNQIAPIDLPLPGISSSDLATPSQNSKLPASELTDAQRASLAAESAAFAARRPKGPATSIRVFGSGELTGRKFVFLVDRSRSMGAQGLDVLSAATQELEAAVNQLEKHHQFQVIGYHNKTLPIDRRRLLFATDENKKRVGPFMRNLAAFGSTAHDLALNTALALNPDVLVFITDGGLPELNEAQLNQVRRAAGGAQVHCLQFGAGPLQQSTNFMKKLAAQNQGTYRYIDVTEWKR